MTTFGQRYFFNLSTSNKATRTASANSTKSMESDHGCTSRIFFDNAGDNVTLTLYNVTLTSQKHVNTLTNVIAAEQTIIIEDCFFFAIKYRLVILLKNT